MKNKINKNEIKEIRDRIHESMFEEKINKHKDIMLEFINACDKLFNLITYKEMREKK